MRAKMMRFSTPVLLAGLLAATSGVALGQTVQRGDEVSVNPLPAGGGSQTLLYPGGQYMRVVQPLRQPGQTDKESGALQLHMPGKSSARAPVTRAASAAPRPAVSRPAVVARAPEPKPEAPKPEAPKPEASKRVAVAAPPPPQQQPAPQSNNGYNAGYGNFGAPAGGGDSIFQGGQAQSAPPRQQVAKASPAPSAAMVSPSEPGLTKRSVILFASGASDPAQSALGSIKFLAGDLNASMTGSGSRIQLLAYGGDKGDKGSDARRLSLKRALAIRQVLIDDGVPAERIDVRAMGGADDGGPADRVDVFVKA